MKLKNLRSPIFSKHNGGTGIVKKGEIKGKMLKKKIIDPKQF